MPGSASLAVKLMRISGCQADFHRQWQHLHNLHVRALAWMLTAPVLLDATATIWKGMLVAAPVKDGLQLQTWLGELDQNPEDLLSLLRQQPSRRLGLYAETLFAFYLDAHGLLFAHGLQVHHKGVNTVGEFDFLLQTELGYMHWELATKFYLYHPCLLESGATGAPDLYNYLGPNLADSLGAKLQKIIGQQLQLSSHEQAQAVLPGKIVEAKALVLGWLFYRETQFSDEAEFQQTCAIGLNSHHCHGAIWSLAEVATIKFEHALLLERLEWLAPAQVSKGLTQNKSDITNVLKKHFEHSESPVMLALMQESQAGMQESQRGMVVPDDWFALADQVLQKRAI